MRSLTGIMLFFVFSSLSYGQSYKQIKIFLTSPGDIAQLAAKGLAVEDSYFEQKENSISMVLDEK